MAIDADTPIHDYFESLGEPIRGKLLRREKRFRDMGYLTAGSFESVFNVLQLPDFGKSRSMVTTVESAFTNATDIGYQKRQVSKTFRLSTGEVDELMKSTTSVSRRSTKRAKRPSSEGFYGSLGKSTLRPNRSFKIVNVADLKYRVPKETKGPWVLPDIQSRIGGVWDQGRRGTCVAFAVAGLGQYLHPYATRPSPQFLYHQCKMIDGIKNLSGTYLETAMKILADGTLSGRRQDWGTADSGIPDEMTWPYEGSPKQGNESQTPPPISLRGKIYESPRWGSLGGEVIRLSRGLKVVDELRTLLRSANIPIPVGLDVFPSWHNQNTTRTGLITVPMTDDKPSGGHAMLVCGYDDQDRVFLVRNSWGDTWAPQNPWKMPGYALIPYRYLEKFQHGSFSLRHLSIMADINVPEDSRLYNNPAKVVSRKTTYTVADLRGSLSPRSKAKKGNARRASTGKGFWRRLTN